jgi:hypothetical protein
VDISPSRHSLSVFARLAPLSSMCGGRGPGAVAQIVRPAGVGASAQSAGARSASVLAHPRPLTASETTSNG